MILKAEKKKYHEVEEKIGRRTRMNDDIKLLLNKIKSEKEKKYNNFDKIKQIKNLLVRIQ